MPRFILIDHSITGHGGHYYEYAEHVLRSAQECGFKPVLVTNRGFSGRNGGELPWSVYSVYEHGFWFRLSLPRWYHIIRSGFGLAQKINRLLAVLPYSRLARLYIRLVPILGYLRQHVATIRRVLNPVWLLSSEICKALIFVVTSLLKAALKYGLLVLRFVHTTLKSVLSAICSCLMLTGRGTLAILPPGVRKCVCTVGRRLTPLAKALGGPFVVGYRVYSLLVDVSRKVLMTITDRRKSTGSSSVTERLLSHYACYCFARDTKSLFARITVQEGDHIFLPTVSETELKAVLNLVNRNRRVLAAQWHMLFRRNLLPGRPSLFGELDAHLTPMRQVFKRSQAIAGDRIRFYTDTEQLTHQYSWLAQLRVSTLPIPHTRPPVNDTAGKSPLRVVYIGDARTEKGYQYLPRIVQDLWADYISLGKVEFVLQSNYNVPNGEAKPVVARWQLLSSQIPGVRLIVNALKSDEYWQLLASADVNLLMYDSSNYYARSSGILAESLAAGIPVIVPSGTWMSKQFIDKVYAYQHSIAATMTLLVSYSGSDMAERLPMRSMASVSGSDWYVLSSQTPTSTWLDVPQGSTHVLISFGIRADVYDPLVHCHIVELDEYGHDLRVQSHNVEHLSDSQHSCVFIPLNPRCARLVISFRNGSDDHLLRLTGISFNLLRTKAVSTPISAIGRVYGEPGEVTEILKEVIDNYIHYRESAIEFSRDWMERHSGTRLIHEVTEGVIRPAGLAVRGASL